VRADGDEVRFRFSGDLPELPASRRRITDLRQRFSEAGLTDLLP